MWVRRMKQAKKRRGPYSVLSIALASLATLIARAKDVIPIPPAPPATRPITRPATSLATAPASQAAFDPIPEATLQQMYRRELGPKYNPAEAAKLYAAHQLLEQYFATQKAADRKAITNQLIATELDPNVLGRIVRLRMNWPTLDGGGVYYVNERVGPHFARYFFGVPANYDRAKPWPLVVKLPTAHAFLTNPMPDAEAVTRIYADWIDEELRAHPDAIVMMPLLNLDELYGPSYLGMNGVIQPIQHVAGRANVDPARVYMVGHSMAAHAVWNLSLHYPTYFASVNALAGAATGDWQRLRLSNLRNVLPVVWHDATDQVIKVGHSRGLVEAMRKLKMDVEYEETKTLGHAPDPAAAERAYAKMRARTRELYPAQVWLQSNRPDTMFNRADWLQVYQPAMPGQERRLLFRRGTGHMVVNQNAYRADATASKGNRIDLTTQNVDALRLYFNDQMVDLNGAVTVIVNKKAKYEGPLKVSLDEMLKDQLFMGRGWRYFTAVLDIDLIDRPATRPTTRSASGPATAPATKPAGKIILGPIRD